MIETLKMDGMSLQHQDTAGTQDETSLQSTPIDGNVNDGENDFTIHESLSNNVESSQKEHLTSADSTENVQTEFYSDDEDVLSPTPSSKTKTNYHRHPKPPFSYIALIAMAIKDSPTGKLTLAEINEYLMKRYPFFRGSYTGWRNSVRHNLSLNECFTKILRDPSRPWGKDNYWTINENSDYTFADGVFRRRRKRINRSHSSDKSLLNGVQRLDRHHHQLRYAKKKGKFTGPFSIDSILGNIDIKDEERGEDHLDSNSSSPSDAYNHLEQRVATTGSPRDSNYKPTINLFQPSSTLEMKTFCTHPIRPVLSTASSLEHVRDGKTNYSLELETLQYHDSKVKYELNQNPNNGCVLAAAPYESLLGERRVGLPWGRPLVSAGIHAGTGVYFAPVVRRNNLGFLVENLISR